MPDEKDKYAAQKKYLAKRKNLRVWVDAEKYDRFKALAKENGQSIYGLINQYIDDYLAEHSR